MSPPVVKTFTYFICQMKKKTSYLCLFPSDCLSRLKFVWRFVRSFCFLHTGFLGILRSLGRGLGFFL